MSYNEWTTTPGDIQTKLRATIPLNSAWSLVESTTFGTGAYPADVYKCDHTVSGLSADFYVMVLLNVSTFRLGLAEGYNTATHKPQRPAMAATSTMVTLQADGGIIPATTELDWYDGTSGGLSVAAVDLGASTSARTYRLSVAKDGFALFYTSSGTSAIFYVGAYESTLGVDDPLPILVGGSQAATKMHSTRHPRRGGQATGYAGNLNGAASGDTNSPIKVTANPGADYVPFAPPGSTGPDSFDFYRQTDPGAAKIAVLNSFSTSVGLGRNTNGWRRGWMKHLRYTAPSGLTQGDTVAIDGVPYYYSDVNGVWVETNPA